MLLETVIFSKDGSQPIVLFPIMGPFATIVFPKIIDTFISGLYLTTAMWS